MTVVGLALLVAIFAIAALIVVLVREAIGARERQAWLQALMQRRRTIVQRPPPPRPSQPSPVDELGDTSRYGSTFFRREE